MRFSLCCREEGCRKRMLPKSVLFDGRRVYFRVVILMTIALCQQRPRGKTMRQLQSETGAGADFKTIRRWQAEYRQEFEAGRYRLLRGRFCHGLERGFEVAKLFSYFETENDSESGVMRLLQFVAENEHLSPG